MHNGFINVDNEKMSKSVGNFFTVRDIVKDYSYDVIRFFILTGHYRMPINFSADLLTAAANGLERITNAVTNIRFVGESKDRVIETPDEQAVSTLEKALQDARADFVSAMDDDLNTADAITAIFELVRAANTACTEAVPSDLLLKAADLILELSGVLGIQAEAREGAIPKEITDLVAKRAEAKKAKDFALADQIRNKITELGFQVKDTAQGPQVARI